MTGSILAISDLASALSFAGQLASMTLAAMIGRKFKSRSFIWAVAFAGALGAMIAHMLVDGQGAFVLMPFMPMIYFVAVNRREDVV